MRDDCFVELKKPKSKSIYSCTSTDGTTSTDNVTPSPGSKAPNSTSPNKLWMILDGTGYFAIDKNGLSDLSQPKPIPKHGLVPMKQNHYWITAVDLYKCLCVTKEKQLAIMSEEQLSKGWFWNRKGNLSRVDITSSVSPIEPLKNVPFPETFKEQLLAGIAPARITASLFGSVVKAKGAYGNPDTVLQDLLGLRKTESNVHMQRGIDNEDTAVESCVAILRCRLGPNYLINVDKSGLFVPMATPWIGCSKDGEIKLTWVGKGPPPKDPPFYMKDINNPATKELYDGHGLMECKCPVSIKRKVDSKTGKSKVIINQGYIIQCQGNMALLGLKWALLVLWTRKETYLEYIRFDPVFWQQQMNNLRKFYFERYLADAVILYYRNHGVFDKIPAHVLQVPLELQQNINYEYDYRELTSSKASIPLINKRKFV